MITIKRVYIFLLLLVFIAPFVDYILAIQPPQTVSTGVSLLTSLLLSGIIIVFFLPVLIYLRRKKAKQQHLLLLKTALEWVGILVLYVFMFGMTFGGGVSFFEAVWGNFMDGWVELFS